MSAIISDCGKYRYRLERAIAKPFISDVDGILSGKTVAFFGVNPSTATATEDDATVRKWTGFCKHWGARRFIVGNVFAFRATDVGELATVLDPIGPDNAAHIHQIIADADILIPCWGSSTKAPRELRGEFPKMVLRLLESGKPILHLGLTKGSDPKHPLMLGYDTPLTEWGPACMTTEAIRAAFESWAGSRGMRLDRGQFGRYTSFASYECWAAWQAAFDYANGHPVNWTAGADKIRKGEAPSFV